MLKTFLTASAVALLLAACQQSSQMASTPTGSQPQAYTVYFNTDQSVLSPEANATVAQAAAAFRQGGGTAVGVRGHADTVGNAEYNLQLSRRRAAAVKAALQSNGVPATAILSGGVGEQNLPVPTADQVPERRNRSVNIVISRAQSLMSDVDYCQALSATYRRYNPSAIDEAVARAMSLCATDPAAAIPTLEDAVTALRVPLPARVLARS
jgi:hypothetical protein